MKWVRVTGVIVAVDEYSGRNVYTVDDSSGMCIECVCVAPVPVLKKEGTVVSTHLDQIAKINQALASTSASTSTTNTRKPDVKGKNKGGDKEKGTEKSGPSVQEPVVPWADMDVGTVVKVKGRVSEYWKQKQIEVVKVEVLRCTDQEVRCWNEVIDFRRDVLSKLWVVGKEEEEKCRRGRERELRRAAKERGKGKDWKGKERMVNKDDSKWTQEREGARKKRKELERKEEEAKRKKEKEEVLKAKNKVNYPSLAVRRAAAGKYDALGI